MKNKDKEIEPEDKAPDLPKRIAEMFDLFFNLEDDAPFWEQFESLSRAIVAYRVYLLKRHRVTGKKRVDAEDLFLFDCMEQHKHIEKIMMSAKKMDKLKDVIPPNLNGDLLGKIVNIKSTVGDIVRTVPVNTKTS